MAKRKNKRLDLAREMADKFCGFCDDQQAEFFDRVFRNSLEWGGDPREYQFKAVKNRLTPGAKQFLKSLYD